MKLRVTGQLIATMALLMMVAGACASPTEPRMPDQVEETDPEPVDGDKSSFDSSMAGPWFA